jgi:hypothetical protein
MDGPVSLVWDLSALDATKPMRATRRDVPVVVVDDSSKIWFHPSSDTLAAASPMAGGATQLVIYTLPSFPPPSPGASVSTRDDFPLLLKTAGVATAVVPGRIAALAFSDSVLAVADSQADLQIYTHGGGDGEEEGAVRRMQRVGETLCIPAAFDSAEIKSRVELDDDGQRLYFYADFAAGPDDAVLIFDVALLVRHLQDPKGDEDQASHDWRRAVVARLACSAGGGPDAWAGTNKRCVPPTLWEEDEYGVRTVLGAVTLEVGHSEVVVRNNSNQCYHLFRFVD